MGLLRKARADGGGEASGGRVPRWVFMYFGLAMFDVLVVLISLFVSHQVMSSYQSSVAVNKEWAGHLGQIADLRTTAGDVNAPGNDVFDTRKPDAEAARVTAALGEFDAGYDAIAANLASAGTPEQSQKLTTLLAETQTALTGMTDEANKIFGFFRDGQPARAGERMATMDRKYGEVNAAFASLEGEIRQIQQDELAAQAASVNRLRVLELLVAGFIILMVCGATYYGHRIFRTMQRTSREREDLLAEREELSAAQAARAARVQEIVTGYATFAERVAGGDLNARVEIPDDRELAALAANLNGMAEALGHVSVEVRSASTGLSATARQILTTVSEHSAATTQQAAAISQTTGTVERVRGTAESVASQARSLVEQSQAAVVVSEEGTETIRRIITGMGDIQGRVEAIARDVAGVSERSEAIAEIARTVNDLADQSNMLALNATIEAARAGEHGRGFAIVAEEVRNLAEQSKAATAQVQAILIEIQSATGKAVDAARDGTRVVDEGVRLAEQAGEALGGLAENVQQTAAAAEVIARSVGAQSHEIATISGAMNDVSSATTQLSDGASASQQAAEALDELARSLTELTGGLRGREREPAGVA